MFVTVKTLVAKSITPPEAHIIAEEFRRAANQARSLAGELQSQGHVLQNNWLGNSKMLFFERFNKEPPALHSLAEWLLDRANYIESIKVTVYELVEQKIPIKP